MTVKIATLEDWGKKLLEEVLLRAAKRVSEQPPSADTVEVMLSFRLRADAEKDYIEISIPSSVDPTLVMRLTKPF